MEKRWENFFEKKHEVDYQPETMYQMLYRTAQKYPNDVAYEFMGANTTYSEFIDKVEVTAKALTAIGIREGDAVTVCMPNCPQAIDTFYALSRIGAISNMIHPLSAQGEITFYLNCSKSKAILTLDQFYEKVVAARADCDHTVIIIMAQIQDELPFVKGVAYRFMNRGKYTGLPNKSNSIKWKEFIHMGKKFPLSIPKVDFKIDRIATILYSGGTTGTTKGIMLSDLNMNALSMQTISVMGVPWERGLKILAAMPLFHGFGLGIGIHTCLTNGICCSLLPQFS
ncbi:MAG: acyl--CoA ligase, partial [Erysipelotrichaceae bacterium]|nr:acyl--CoA ligase [Erysipelotrichaceae bacterium]